MYIYILSNHIIYIYINVLSLEYWVPLRMWLLTLGIIYIYICVYIYILSYHIIQYINICIYIICSIILCHTSMYYIQMYTNVICFLMHIAVLILMLMPHLPRIGDRRPNFCLMEIDKILTKNTKFYRYTYSP